METIPKQKKNEWVEFTMNLNGDYRLHLLMFCIATLLMCAVFPVGSLVGRKYERRKNEAQAVKMGAAYYDPQTGTLTWIERPAIIIQRTKVYQDQDGTIRKEKVDGNN